MTRVTGYKCIFQTNDERFKFALTLAGEEAGDADFIVANPDAAETLVDMFDDSSEAHFDAESGELTFTFETLELEAEEEGDDLDPEGEDESDAGEDGEEDAEMDSDTEETEEVEEESREAAGVKRAKGPAKQKSRRSAA